MPPLGSPDCHRSENSMSVSISLKNEEIDVLYDLIDGDSVNDPSDPRYELLRNIVKKVEAKDSRDLGDDYQNEAIIRNEKAKGLS